MSTRRTFVTQRRTLSVCWANMRCGDGRRRLLKGQRGMWEWEWEWERPVGVSDGRGYWRCHRLGIRRIVYLTTHVMQSHLLRLRPRICHCAYYSTKLCRSTMCKKGMNNQPAAYSLVGLAGPEPPALEAAAEEADAAPLAGDAAICQAGMLALPVRGCSRAFAAWVVALGVPGVGDAAPLASATVPCPWRATSSVLRLRSSDWSSVSAVFCVCECFSIRRGTSSRTLSTSPRTSRMSSRHRASASRTALAAASTSSRAAATRVRSSSAFAASASVCALRSSRAACAASYCSAREAEVSWNAVEEGGLRCGVRYFCYQQAEISGETYPCKSGEAVHHSAGDNCHDLRLARRSSQGPTEADSRRCRASHAWVAQVAQRTPAQSCHTGEGGRAHTQAERWWEQLRRRSSELLAPALRQRPG